MKKCLGRSDKVTTYEKIASSFVHDGEKEFYRFQGHNSFDYFNIKTNKFDSWSSHYVYFSGSVNHHYYFMLKRLKQLLNMVVLDDTSYMVSGKSLQDINTYKKIRSIVADSCDLKNLNSISLVCDREFFRLISENSVRNSEKVKRGMVEKVDRRVYGGGYGVTDAWLDLFNDLAYFSSYSRITNNDILFLLREMRGSGKFSNPETIKSVLADKLKTFKIFEHLYDDFHKYDIMDDLERIIDGEFYLQTSGLANNPSETIKTVLSSYQSKREKVLRLVDKHYRSY